eukprot:jgi/Astpho2/1616/e_gw1.00028.79.1_t
MVHLEPDAFLSQLDKLFERNKSSGSVCLTMKRTNMKPRNSRFPQVTAEYRCLVRASDDKRKITTEISSKEQLKFQESYSTILRAHMNGLKRRDKKAVKAGKAK